MRRKAAAAPGLRDGVLASLSKTGDASTLQVGREELRRVIAGLVTTGQAREFVTILCQTTSLQPLLMRKATFLLIDELVQSRAELLDGLGGRLASYLVKRAGDPEVTQLGY